MLFSLRIGVLVACEVAIQNVSGEEVFLICLHL